MLLIIHFILSKENVYGGVSRFHKNGYFHYHTISIKFPDCVTKMLLFQVG